ncbi:MAG: co-chaperone DjlA [Gammaproteobacteria bacterium]
MKWWGKVIGGIAGYLLGGPLVAAAGVVLGHVMDGRRRAAPAPGERSGTQAAFLQATFSVMGYLCKADGRVSEEEIAMASRIMDRMALDPVHRQLAMDMFRDGKAPGFRLDEVLNRFRARCGRHPMLLGLFTEIQLSAALADGALTPQEDSALRYICVRLGIPRPMFEQLLRAAGAARGGRAREPERSTPADDLESAYGTLGIEVGASDAEVKRAYRRLLSRHHPDKLAGEGMSEEMIRMANDRTQAIRRAYERIQSVRGAA